MPTVDQKNSVHIKKMYDAGHSVREIAEHYNVSQDAVYYFFRKNNIVRRTAGQNNALAFQNKLGTFSLKTSLTASERELKVAGVMLYWGEGSQWSGEKIVDFTNSNPGMVKVFLAFLRVICQIDESKLRVYLYCYRNQDPKALMRHWAKVTGIPLSQFTKPYVRQDFNPEKEGKMKNGMVHIRYNDKKLLNKIRELIQEYSTGLI